MNVLVCQATQTVFKIGAVINNENYPPTSKKPTVRKALGIPVEGFRLVVRGNAFSASIAKTTQSAFDVKITNVVLPKVGVWDNWEDRAPNIAVLKPIGRLKSFQKVRLSFNISGSKAGMVFQAGICHTSYFIEKAKSKAVIAPVLLDLENIETGKTGTLVSFTTVVTPEMANGPISICFFLGKDRGDYSITNCSYTLIGLEDSAWYQKAQSRIDTLRMGNFSLDLAGLSGVNAVESISVSLYRHDFIWGTALDFNRKYTSDQLKKYKETALSLFDAGVIEDDFKWQEVAPDNPKPNYARVYPYLDWADSNLLAIRGHCVWWGKRKYAPSWLNGLTPSQQVAAIKTRTFDCLGTFKGRFLATDVVNEPIHQRELQANLPNHIVDSTYKWARQADPSTPLYLNDYRNFDKYDNVRLAQLAKQMVNNKVPLDGLGLQGHFDNGRVNWLQLKTKLDILSTVGLALTITEFDMYLSQIGLTQQQYAEDLDRMMVTSFSYPNVNGLLIWGFWAGNHWREGAIVDSTFNLLPAGLMWQSNVRRRWHSEASVANTTKLKWRGYYGTYKVTVTFKYATKPPIIAYARYRKIRGKSQLVVL